MNGLLTEMLTEPLSFTENSLELSLKKLDTKSTLVMIKYKTKQIITHQPLTDLRHCISKFVGKVRMCTFPMSGMPCTCSKHYEYCLQPRLK